MSLKTDTFAALDRQKGIAPLPEQQGEEMPLPAWYRSVYYTPFDQFTIGDLGKAVRQQLYVDQIVPLVIERLREDSLAGELFDGELLVSLRSVAIDYWKTHRNDADTLRVIINIAWNGLPEDIQSDARKILQFLEK